MEQKDCLAVIMAGGAGERFWPLSRQQRPKQVLSLSGSRSLIQLTVERMAQLVSQKDIYIVTTENCAQVLSGHLRGISEEQIIREPVGRNTAPCVVLAAVHAERYGDPVMLIVPSDHVIKDEEKFYQVVRSGIAVAKAKDVVVTIGITPTAPETGYGYIHRGELLAGYDDVYQVKQFVEKPDRNTALRYLADGSYFWNSGMFIVRASVLLNLVQEHLPGIYAKVPELRLAVEKGDRDLLKSCYESLESVSIDYGIMEKAANVLMVAGDFGWDDVGSWTALERVRPLDGDGNIVSGEHVGVDTQGCIIQGGFKLIATVGLRDLIIVETEDSILVCPKDRAQDVKLVVDRLKKEGRNEYL